MRERHATEQAWLNQWKSQMTDSGGMLCSRVCRVQLAQVHFQSKQVYTDGAYFGWVGISKACIETEVWTELHSRCHPLECADSGSQEDRCDSGQKHCLQPGHQSFLAVAQGPTLAAPGTAPQVPAGLMPKTHCALDSNRNNKWGLHI